MMVKRGGRPLLMVLVLLAFLTGRAFWAFRYVGWWLVVNDASPPVRAIAALSGLILFLTFS